MNTFGKVTRGVARTHGQIQEAATTTSTGRRVDLAHVTMSQCLIPGITVSPFCYSKMA